MKDFFIKTNILEAYDTLTPNQAEINFPAENVLESVFYKRWKTTETTAQLDFTFAVAQSMRGFVVRVPTIRDPADVFHNFGVNDTIRILVTDSDENGTVIADTGEIEFVPDDLGYFYHEFDADLTGIMFIRVIIDPPDLLAAGDELMIENMFAGLKDTPSFNVQPGGIDEREDFSEVGIGEFSGANIGEARARYDSLSRSWDVWSDADLAWWKRFERTHGTTRPFVYVARPDRPLVKQVMIARFTDGGAPKESEGDNRRLVVRAVIIENR